MDIKWKDGNGNILNANKNRIIYLDANTNIKTTIKKEEVKKITIEDGMMNIFKDFENDLELTIVIPKGSKRNAVKIFNEYDKTGTILKGKSNNFLIDLILESSVITGHPLTGIVAILFIVSIILLIATLIIYKIFGEAGMFVLRVIIFGYPIYAVMSYIYLRIKRKKIMEREKISERN